MVKAIELLNKQGYVLRGFLDLPDGASKIVVFLHGFTGNKTEHAGHFRNLARLLSKKGVASLRMDYHGNGESDGEFQDFNFDYAIDDANLFIDYARNLKGIEEVTLLGFSLGGGIAGIVANDKNVDKLVLWSPAGCMKEHVINYFERCQKIDEDNIIVAGGFILNRQFLDTIKKYEFYSYAKNFTKPVLIVHGEKDLSVDISYGKRYNEEYKDSVMHIVAESGHGYDKPVQSEELYKLSIDFIVDGKR